MNIQRHCPITINVTTVTRGETIRVRDFLLQPLLCSCIPSNSRCRCKTSFRRCIWVQREFRAMNSECRWLPAPRPAAAPRPCIPKLVRGSHIWRPGSTVGAPVARAGSHGRRAVLGARVEVFPHASRAGVTHRQRLAQMGHLHVSSVFVE